MDLFLSAQSMSAVAFAAAGCVVAAGAISSSLARRRARRKQDSTPTSSTSFSGGRQVVVVGRLHVDGSCCPRLEDAAPVAASSYLRNSGRLTSVWCDQAKTLWLEVGGARVEIQGPVLVDVGSEEQYPAVALDRMRGRARNRVYAAHAHELPRRKDIPRRGVFRSLRAGDEVVVIGVVERTAEGGSATGQSGAGWRLVPDATGVLWACYRRRPRIRGAFGSLQLWAAAIVSTGR